MNRIRILVNPYMPLLQQIARFGIVGLTAATIHFTTVVLLVQTQHYPPLWANVFGFLIAVQMSYWGHRRWTFSDTATLHRVAFPKLIAVQLVNFAANETLFYIFLQFKLPYTVALLIVLTTLPIFTFVSSKLWVFR